MCLPRQIGSLLTISIAGSPAPAHSISVGVPAMETLHFTLQEFCITIIILGLDRIEMVFSAALLAVTAMLM